MMNIRRLHPWDVSPAEAVRLQEQLRGQVIVEDRLGEAGNYTLARMAEPGRAARVRTVAGVDVGVKDEIAQAAVVVLRYPDLTVLEIARTEAPVTFPYIPGLLAFREAPVILAACQKLQTEPDLFIFDGQGIAHPRRLGIASHVGLFLDRPAIGCAKSRLCGEHAEPPPQAGAWVLLADRGETIGAAVRTRERANPIYVSIGHRVDLPTAIHYVLATCRGYRLPEPCRLAHQAAGQPDSAMPLFPTPAAPAPTAGCAPPTAARARSGNDTPAFRRRRVLPGCRARAGS
jgi:deoxyribonuclease V